MFENVDGRMIDRRRSHWCTISSPFCSGEQIKKGIKTAGDTIYTKQTSLSISDGKMLKFNSPQK